MSVGETLSHARRNVGLSLDDVSADTRIRASVVAAIENDDFDPCGGVVYARGHIRSIARVLGIDADPLIAEFDASHQVDLPPVAATVAPQPTDPDLLSRSARHRPNWTAAMATALAGICIFALVGLIVSHSHGSSPSRHHLSAQSGSGATHTGAPPASPPPTAAAEIPSSKATMLIRALRGQTWLQVTSKNGAHTFFSGLLPLGQHRLFASTHGLAFVIGNAPAVDVVVNGHDIGSPPSSGNVARGNVSPGAATVQQA
ncbi:MAG: helix-turn-helix domain-containing protein [Mycobacteriales bacterium]